MGGPLMGFTLPWLDVPVVKITNCLLAPSVTEMGETQEEQGCIRCSACADACPADLLPQQLYWFSKGQQHDKATTHNLADCIECGACAWVCPSNIPLVQYFRQEKAEIAAIRQEEQRAAEAKARFEARQARLEREKAARQERHKKQPYNRRRKIRMPLTPRWPACVISSVMRRSDCYSIRQQTRQQRSDCRPRSA